MIKNTKINGWVAAAFTALATTVGLGIVVLRDPLDGHEPVQVKDARFDKRTGTIQTESLQSFSIFAAYSHATHGSDTTHNQNVGIDQEKIEVEDKRSQEEIYVDLSKSAFKKFQKETLSPIKRFNHLFDSYKFIGNDLKKVEPTLGITPGEMIAHLRQAGLEAIREYQSQGQLSSDLERIMQTKEILTAAGYAQIQENGKFPLEKQNMDGVDIEQLENYKASLIVPAVKEATELLKTMPSLHSMGNNDLLKYWDMLDLAVYAIEKNPDGGRLDQATKDQRDHYNELTYHINKELIKRQQAESLTALRHSTASSTAIPSALKL